MLFPNEAWYQTGAGLESDEGIPTEIYEPQVQQDEVVTQIDATTGIPANTYEDNTSAPTTDWTQVSISLTNAGLKLAQTIAQQTGMSQAQAQQQVASQYRSDPSLVTVKEEMPVWGWVAIGLGVTAALALGGVAIVKKTRGRRR